MPGLTAALRVAVVVVAAVAVAGSVTAPAGADTKRFTVTIKAPATVFYFYESDDGGPCVDNGPQGGHEPAEIRITGTVHPVRAGRYVTIYQKFDGGSGQVEGRARVRSSGRYTFVDRPTSSRPRSYKAKMPAVGSYAAGYSPYTRVRIVGECDE